MKALRRMINKEIRKALKEVTALPTDMEKIEDFIMSSPQFETMNTSNIKAAARDMFDEWKAVSSNYPSIEAYFEEVEENGGEEAFMEGKSKTKMMVKRLKEDTAYQEFFKKAMAKFNISALSDLQDADKKKEFFSYIETNYRGKDEMNEGAILKAINPGLQGEVKVAVQALETMLIGQLTAAGVNRNVRELAELIIDIIDAAKDEERNETSDY